MKSHHELTMVSTGHAGAILQARQLGNELVVGTHTDDEILEHKGPTVMRMEERYIMMRHKLNGT